MDWTNAFQFRAPARIVFGPGSAGSVGEIARDLGSKAPLVLTDPTLHRLGITRAVETSLGEAGLRVEVFAEVATEPTLASVESAVQAFRERGCDLIVAVGGGSSIDTAKSVSLLLGNEGKLSEYQQRRVGAEWRTERRVQRRGTEIIAIPTTAGTGSEVTSGSGVFDPATGIKGWAGDPLLRPSVAVCDPLLTLSMPPRVTADTGLDALSQSIECYVNGGFKPFADALALEAIAVIGQNLPRAFANGDDLAARSAMLGAATMTGVAFTNGGLIHVHTYAEVLGDLTHLPHGRLIGLMLPHVLEWSLPGCTEKLATIGRVLGEKVDGLSAREAAERALGAVRRLCSDVEVTEPLRTHGVSEETLRITAERVFAQHAARSATGPRGFRSVDEVLSLLERAY
ncbi:MAG TPA: iron-containing alcohol dehydrogenase [Chloroflexota bacterium]|nr:iron-containing alcohol dehydrogenase [Chloroflexota bacterium]